jgi:hypothetical protein
MDLLAQAGFDDIQRLDHAFFQPMIVGTKRAQPPFRVSEVNPI